MTTAKANGDYIQGQFRSVVEGNGEVISRNPGNLDEGDTVFRFSYDHIGEATTAA